MDTKKLLILIVAILATFSIASLSLADSVELIASKTSALKDEQVLLVALAKFNDISRVRVTKIEIFENNNKIKECTNQGSSQFFCFVFVTSNTCPITKEYFAKVTYVYTTDPTIESNRVRITWNCPSQNQNVTPIDIASIINLLNNITNNNQININNSNSNINEVSLVASLNNLLNLINNLNNTNININDIVNTIAPIINLLLQSYLNNTNLINNNNTNINVNDIANVIETILHLILQSYLNNTNLNYLNNTVINSNSDQTTNSNINVLNIGNLVNFDQISRLLLTMYGISNSVRYIPSFSTYEVDGLDFNYCLDFEKVENRIIEDGRVNVFVRNCGNIGLYNVTVMFVLDENVQIKVIPSILPNEVKFVYFNANIKDGERKLATVFAFNNLVSIKYDFFVEKTSHVQILKITVDKRELVKGTWNEIYITIKNNDIKAFENLPIYVETERGLLTSLETSKITLLPLQTKVIKVSIFVNEDFEKSTTNVKVKVGEVENYYEFKVTEKPKEFKIEVNWSKILEILAFAVIIVLAVALLVLLLALILRGIRVRRKYIEMP